MITIVVSDQIRTQFFLVVISDNVTRVILAEKAFANWYSKGRHGSRETQISLSGSALGLGGRQSYTSNRVLSEIVDLFLEYFTFLKKAIYGLDMPFDYFIGGWMKACAIWRGFRVYSLSICKAAATA
jgi:hypothetical protein